MFEARNKCIKNGNKAIKLEKKNTNKQGSVRFSSVSIKFG